MNYEEEICDGCGITTGQSDMEKINGADICPDCIKKRKRKIFAQIRRKTGEKND